MLLAVVAAALGVMLEGAHAVVALSVALLLTLLVVGFVVARVWPRRMAPSVAEGLRADVEDLRADVEGLRACDRRVQEWLARLERAAAPPPSPPPTTQCVYFATQGRHKGQRCAKLRHGREAPHEFDLTPPEPSEPSVVVEPAAAAPADE